MTYRDCPHCGGDITEQLDASYEEGFAQGYRKRAMLGARQRATYQDAVRKAFGEIEDNERRSAELDADL